MVAVWGANWPLTSRYSSISMIMLDLYAAASIIVECLPLADTGLLS
ncbi:MAG: hypothetical protein Ct9H300mP12_04260 [Acidimicrobiales bacterium]|nr:MAG: hypothetical protein Ct9H300mP12_04260 [Acidimicrobiales bacterium]